MVGDAQLVCEKLDVSRWWLGLPAAQASVRCAGHEHRLRWEGGELSALDHEDLDAERTLAALGGERCACVDVLDAWAAHRDDIRVLVLASRGVNDPLMPREGEARFGGGGPHGGFIMRTAGGGGQASGARRVARRRPALGNVGAMHVRTVHVGRLPAASARAGRSSAGAVGASLGRHSQQQAREEELTGLLDLGGGLPERLLATVAAGWRERIIERDRAVRRVRPQLEAALYGRVCATLRAWLGDASRPVRLRMLDEGKQPAIAYRDGAIEAELPFGWLVEVWASGLATVWGRFCLQAFTSDGSRWNLSTIGPDIGTPAQISLQLGTS